MDPTLIVLIVYLVLIFTIAFIFSRKENLEGYFLNKQNTNTTLMTFANVSTLIGAGATVAIVAEVYNSGISYGMALPISFLFGAFILSYFSPKIREFANKHKVYTMVDFFGYKYDKKTKLLIGYSQVFVLTLWISIQAMAFASLAAVLTNLNFEIALVLAASVTILYTAVGGLKIDIITDFFQFWIIIFVLLVTTILAYQNIGSITLLFSNLPKGHLDPFAFGGVVWSIGVILLGGFMYLSGNMHWQRILSAQDSKTASRSFIYALPFILLISFISIFLGFFATNSLGDVSKDNAIFEVLKMVLPPWLLGVGLASILAIIMSSIDSILIGGSTIISREVFEKFKIKKSNELLVARLVTAAFGTIGFAIAYLIPDIVRLTLFQAYFAVIFIPPIFTLFFSKKISSNAVFYSFLIPFISLLTLSNLVGKNVFILNLFLGIFILLFFDKIFKNY